MVYLTDRLIFRTANTMELMNIIWVYLTDRLIFRTAFRVLYFSWFCFKGVPDSS